LINGTGNYDKQQIRWPSLEEFAKFWRDSDTVNYGIKG
jgi:hypothetical protein